MSVKVYVGTYTEAQNGKGEAIYAFDFDEEKGTLVPAGVTPGVVNPSWLVVNDNRTALYSTSEGDPGEVVAFRIEPKSGALAELNRVSSEGISPCYLSLTADGRYLLAANYTSGSFAAIPVATDGSLEAASDAVQRNGVSVDSSRQEGPHAHMISPSPDGRYVLVTDL
ncbi:MAG: lactonase family protein, partial [Thermomicrobiales bacterium]